MKKIKAAGGVVCRFRNNITEVLLIHRNGVWDLPKGKLEDGEKIEECAVREVAEEAGLYRLPKLDKPLGATIHDYRENGEMIEKETHWWSMQLAEHQEEFTPQNEEGIKRVGWKELENAGNLVGYENLRDVLNRFSVLK